MCVCAGYGCGGRFDVYDVMHASCVNMSKFVIG